MDYSELKANESYYLAKELSLAVGSKNKGIKLSFPFGTKLIFADKKIDKGTQRREFRFRVSSSGLLLYLDESGVAEYINDDISNAQVRDAK